MKHSEEEWLGRYLSYLACVAGDWYFISSIPRHMTWDSRICKAKVQWKRLRTIKGHFMNSRIEHYYRRKLNTAFSNWHVSQHKHGSSICWVLTASASTITRPTDGCSPKILWMLPNTLSRVSRSTGRNTYEYAVCQVIVCLQLSLCSQGGQERPCR